MFMQRSLCSSACGYKEDLRVFFLDGSWCGLVENLTDYPCYFVVRCFWTFCIKSSRIYWIGFLFGGFKVYLFTGSHSSGIHFAEQASQSHVRDWCAIPLFFLHFVNDCLEHIQINFKKFSHNLACPTSLEIYFFW